VNRARIADLIRAERGRQENRHPAATCLHPIGDAVKVAVLLEEVGEVARAVLDGDLDTLTDELVQVAAVAVAWLEAL
jgi:hypothetical protein